MELTQAIDILKRSAASKQEEVDSLNLAVSVLEDRFSPELQVLESAKQAVAEKEAIISQKTAEIEAISTEKATLETRVQELEKGTVEVKSEEVPAEEPVAEPAPAEEVA